MPMNRFSKDLDELGQVLRSHHNYDEELLREISQRLTAVEKRLSAFEQNNKRNNKRTRYKVLRGARTRALRALYATGKVSYDDLGEAFGISRQRVEQIVNKKATA